jgi:hypothetical protein
MPNWITNNLELKGNAEQVAAILEFVKSDEREFDFNKVAPIPKELEGTQAPTNIISQKEYDKQEKKLAKGKLTKEEKKWGISRGLTLELSKEYQKRFGADNWYNWQCSNWGTKWNANDVFISDNVISFNTAWSAPVPIFVALSEKFPEVEFFIQFADEDFGHNVGEVSLLGGDEIDSNIPDGGSEEAYLLAFEIQGESDYYTWDMLFDIEEDEDIDDNALYKVMIGLSYKENKSVDEDFPTNVLNEFLNLALADENFELATEIRDILKTKEESGEEA